MENSRFAVLIDGENISAKYITCILDEMTKHGVVTYKRIYGDWTSPNSIQWKKSLLDNSVTPIQQFCNTRKKNATDSTLIIDAMDILYTGNVDGFCIVSSDSDFTRLATRLRESGMTVIGMGEEKTPRSFRVACTIFTSLEVLFEQDDKEEIKQTPAQRANMISETKILETIVEILNENENQGKTTELGELGSRLVNKYPDFDVRNYGYSLLSRFLEEMPELELTKVNSSVSVGFKEDNQSKQEILQFIIEQLQESKDQGYGLNELSNKVHETFNKFNVKDYGYAKFSKFVKDIKGIELRPDNKGRDRVYFVLNEE